MRVLLTDDHAPVRRGFRALLEERGHESAGEAGNGREAFELAREVAPDVVLMDLAMPVLYGLAATCLIGAELPGVRVVVLTSSEDDGDLLEAMKAGASGYLRKDAGPEEFFDAIERAAVALDGHLAAVRPPPTPIRAGVPRTGDLQVRPTATDQGGRRRAVVRTGTARSLETR